MITEQPLQKTVRSIAAVVPRYGKNLGGGAEALVKSLIENLSHEQNAPHLEVWTTCAKDHRTWENYYEPGDSIENNIVVKRFPVDERNTELFIKYELQMADGRPLSPQEQLTWMENSVNSKALYEHILNHGEEFDVILFAPYLFATTFWGSLIHPERSVLIPCLHHERYAYQGVIKQMFKKARGLMFNAEPEMQLACSLYGQDIEPKGAVVGMSFDEQFEVKSSLTLEDLRAYFPDLKDRYLLYSGRKEQGKNLDLLIKYFSEYRKNHAGSLVQLVIIGAGEISFLSALPDGVLDLGFVSEEEKLGLMENAMALCQPSVNESFSIVIMEAWLRGAPVLVHSDCAVTHDHVVKSGGGFSFSSSEEFSRHLETLLRDKDAVRQLGKAGRDYVRKEYSWNAVNRRLNEAWKKFGLAS